MYTHSSYNLVENTHTHLDENTHNNTQSQLDSCTTIKNKSIQLVSQLHFKLPIIIVNGEHNLSPQEKKQKE